MAVSEEIVGRDDAKKANGEVRGSGIIGVTDTESEQKENQDVETMIDNQEKRRDVDQVASESSESVAREENVSKGVKRPRSELEQPSVRVTYSSLPRKSIRKLEELMHQWSEWHAKNCSSAEDPQEELEHGEKTYFPAVVIGSDKSATLSFFMDNHVRKRQRIDGAQFESDNTPLYEREYGIALTSDEDKITNELGFNLKEAARCFNCGSYNHSLKECVKPRDATAVTNARKEFQSKKGLNNGPRGSQTLTRYYQSTPGGKYDGLKPGVLCPETREMMGLEELDPPPWLNRMRELGYPPGYLESEEEEESSGIMIYGDEETELAIGRDNNTKSEEPKSHKKMTVDFPGINASIPENAGNKWVTCGNSSNANLSHNPSNNGKIYSPMRTTNVHRHGQWHLRGCVTPPSTLHQPGFSPLKPPGVDDYPNLTPYHPIMVSSHRGIPLPRHPRFWNPASDQVSPYHPRDLTVHSPGSFSVDPSWSIVPEHISPYLHRDFHSPGSFRTHRSYHILG